MAEEDQSETSPQTAAGDEGQETELQASSPPVIELLYDSTTECEEEEVRPGLGQMEEKAFISSLHAFMKSRGTPIERIPHLGFKQINLWRIYKAVEKLGSYDSVTARRLWKKVYDELGGSPGSTSAATCTRRHYERLVLPFERHIKGEEDRPLPPSKPRKPYKRNADGKLPKGERKRKRTHSDRERDSGMEMLIQRSPEAVCQTEPLRRPHRALWAAADQRHPDCPQTGLCSPVYTHLVPVPASGPWTAHVPPAAGEIIISPLEKKKRLAQASLNLPPSPQSEDKERPSVIHCSRSPAPAASSRTCNSSDSSPLPPSPSSSRSPSPYSVSSEDGPDGKEAKPASSSELTQKCFSSSEDSKTAKDSSPQPAVHTKDSKYPTHPFALPPPWTPTSTSSFTKVIPKSVQPLRPAPIRPGCKAQQERPAQQDGALPCAKKLNPVTPWLYQADKREKSRTMLQKVPPSQQTLAHSSSSLPPSCVLSGYSKSGRDSWQQPFLHPALLPSRVRLPQSQLTYRHFPMSPPHSALIGSAVYPYPYSIPLLTPQAAYTLPALHPIYTHKL